MCWLFFTATSRLLAFQSQLIFFCLWDQSVPWRDNDQSIVSNQHQFSPDWKKTLTLFCSSQQGNCFSFRLLLQPGKFQRQNRCTKPIGASEIIKRVSRLALPPMSSPNDATMGRADLNANCCDELVDIFGSIDEKESFACY
jgi:hypothetical protein